MTLRNRKGERAKGASSVCLEDQEKGENRRDEVRAEADSSRPPSLRNKKGSRG